jgi:curved DNA-binding protein CbpA
MADDPYQTLGLAITATEEEIKTAWKQAARDTHPDRNLADPTASLRFVAAREAYELLADPYRRAQYDHTRTLQAQYGAPAPAPKPTQERERPPGWWDDLFGHRPSTQGAPVRVRPSSTPSPYYHQEQQSLESEFGKGFAWNRAGVYTGTAKREKNVFRSRFRNGGKVG